MDTDVLVVGAGPTGLMLANQLARRNVRVLVVDRNPGPARQTRALGVQARTLEIYSHLGIVDRALDLGNRATGANIWANGRRAAWVPFSDSGRGLTPYPFLLVLGQDDNERLLGEALQKQGTIVQWNAELADLDQQADFVVAKIRHPDGQVREVAARWVAGCDGARSKVRELCGIEFQGAPYEHVFYVADTKMSGPMIPNEINVYLWQGGFHLFFPMRGADHWRVVGILPAASRGRDDLTLDEVFPAIRREAGAGLSLEGCSWFSTYRIHHRRAERFRERRCFVLGDAAHIHSPVGAQGMNTGLQDAYNLAWKLALVTSGVAREALLDSYGAERLPVARSLLGSTDRLFSIAVSDGKLTGLARTRVLPKAMALAMRFGRIRAFAFRAISQIGIRYRGSPLSETMPGLRSGAPSAGDRFPWLRLKFSAGGPAEDLFDKLDDTRFALIVVGQPASAVDVPGVGLQTLVVPSDPVNQQELARAKIPRPSFYFLRPDGYVGLAGTRLEAAAVTRYVSERLDVRLERSRRHG